MNIDNYELLVVHFDGVDTASEALTQINQLKKDGSIKYKDAVAAYKSKGKVKLKQTKEKSGIIGGGVLGLLVGVALGGPILGAAAGALLGGTAYRGLNNKEMKELAEELEPDESALFVLVEQADWAAVAGKLPEYKAILYRDVVPVEVIIAAETATENYETAKALDDELATEEADA